MDIGDDPVDCLNSIENLSNATAVRDATLNECRFSRFVGSVLLLVAAFSFLINLRSFVMARKSSSLSKRDSGLVLGMFMSSSFVVTISVPSVVVQCFLCRRLCISFLCSLEGFNSFLNGCTAMYMLVALSLVRFATTANSSLSIRFQRQIEEHSDYLVLICFLLGGLWAIPPLFGQMSSYVPEGLGFHCGLNWFDRTLPGRIYFLLLFLNVFFVPILLVIYVNIYIQRTVYRLTHFRPSVLLELNSVRPEDRMRRHISTALFDKEHRRLRRLHDDRRFVLATGLSVIIYLIAWTPYSVIALSQVFGEHFSLHNPWVMTTSAVLAKLSMITNPIIYMLILENQQSPAKTSMI